MRSHSRDAVFCIRGLRHGTGKKTPSVFDRVTPKFCSRPGGRTGFGSIKPGARYACWPDFSHEPQCSMARKPTKPHSSRTGEKSARVYLSPEKRRDLKILAVTTDTTINALMRRAVDLVLAEHESKPAKRPGSKRTGGKGAKRRAHLG
jgi:hypothetical protein